MAESLSVREIDEAIANARATLKVLMPIEQREACEDYLDDLLDRRNAITNRQHRQASREQ